MANTITLTSTKDGREQWHGLFSKMWKCTGSVVDMEAVAATAIGEFDVTVTGVALGDMVLCLSVAQNLDDGTDQAILTGHVSAANVVTVQLMADNAAFAVDDLNAAVFKMLIGRPNW